jgi:hypothetical protein
MLTRPGFLFTFTSHPALCLLPQQNGSYSGSGPFFDTSGGAVCLGGSGGSLPAGGIAAAIVYSCSYQSFDIATLAAGDDQTLRIYPLEQDAACVTYVPNNGGTPVLVQTCTGLLGQRWAYVGGGWIQSLLDPTLYMAAGNPIQMVPSTSSPTSWVRYIPTGKGSRRPKSRKNPFQILSGHWTNHRAQFYPRG